MKENAESAKAKEKQNPAMQQKAGCMTLPE